MCGIVGIVNYDLREIDSESLRNARDLLERRGPDDAGLWKDVNIGLGHRRLSIIDLSPLGHQPMLSADGRYAIVFNGEIYNYRELRAEFPPIGSTWRSQSDTETILAVYANLGPDCVERFVGMFAFAIWDRQTHSLFVARDRLGVKPFFYHVKGPEFAFASRPRALQELVPHLSRAIDEQAVRYYLEGGYIPGPLSIHKAIHKLLPGHWAIFDSSGLKIKRYWDCRDLPTASEWEKKSEGELVDDLDHLVNDSVKARLVSDVPVGAFLSGGIDSSLVVAVMKRHAPGRVKTFTIGFDDPVHDESKHAAAVAKYLDTEHYTETLRVDDLLNLLPLITEEFDEPLYDSAAIPTMAVSRLARQHVTVSLSGDGGDEFFGGYNYYQILQSLALAYKTPKIFRRILSIAVGSLSVHRAKLLAGALTQSDLVQAFCYARGIAKDFPSLLLPDVAKATLPLAAKFQVAAQRYAPKIAAGEIGMRLDTQFILPDDYLQKVDIASMAFSLESRDPLLDHRLAEWAMRLPFKFKLRKRENKYLLRQLAYRYVPREILDRPKRGFTVPIDRWLRGPLLPWAKDLAADKQLFARLPIDQRAVAQILDLHLSGKRNVHSLLWAVLMLLEFVRRDECR